MTRVTFAIVCSLSVAARLVAQSGSNDIIESADHQRYSLRAYQAGHEDAGKDVREGRLIIESFGLPPPWDADYAKLLKERYGIELRAVAGCVVDDNIVGHRKGYNEVSEAEIQRRFGSDILEKTQLEAKKHWEDNHAK